MNLDDFAKVDGVPRNVLVERIAELVAEVRQMQSEQRASGIVLCMTMRQLGEMEDNLKATQTRCTELLEQVRTLLAGFASKGHADHKVGKLILK